MGKNCKLLKDEIIEFYGEECYDKLLKNWEYEPNSIRDPENPYHVVVVPELNYCDSLCHLCMAHDRKCLCENEDGGE